MDWMDELRGLAVLLVILHHIFGIPVVLGGGAPPWVDFMRVLEPFRMPLLLVLSGMLLPRSLAKPSRLYYWGKVRGILWPFVLWTLITNLVLLHVSNLASPWTWIGGSWHLWFLAVLLACYLVGPLIRWIPAWLWVVPMVMLEPFVGTSSYRRILWYGAFFFLGAALSVFASRWQGVRWPVPAVLLVASAGFGVWVASPVGTYERGPVAFLASATGVAAIVWVAPRAPRIRALQFVGRESMVFYIVHFGAVGATWLLIGELPWWILFPVLAVAAYGVPLLLTRVSSSFLFTLPSLKEKPATASGPATSQQLRGQTS
ncbi:acyltransferase family protein [Brevibacterium yomogidense]|uniref:acyltransferase family protein n=1 Tax=Brevibacterium yomogidense TaxID=946573 RepID=UPI0038CC1D69